MLAISTREVRRRADDLESEALLKHASDLSAVVHDLAEQAATWQTAVKTARRLGWRDATKLNLN